jgi:hypothetical protein
MALDNDFFEPGRASEEGTLDTDAIAGNPADGESGIIPMPSTADNRSPKFLDALGVTFFDADVDVYQVAWAQLGDIRVFRLLNRF